jgi:hypothetical protein
VFGLLCKAYDELHGVETVSLPAAVAQFEFSSSPLIREKCISNVRLRFETSDSGQGSLASVIQGYRLVNVTLEGIK